MRRMLGLIVVAAALAARWSVAENLLHEGDSVAICGDSITEQKQYSVFLDDFLLMCQPAAGLRAVQFGWSGEQAGGLAGRMANDVLPFGFSVATTCYGMNDGGYAPMNEEKGKAYRHNQQQIVQSFKKAGVRVVVVGSPGAVDTETFRHDPQMAAMYNPTLAALRDIAKSVAADEGVVFANVYDPMMDVMTKAKARYGKAYHVAGGDGVHPAANGHLVMAYAFLKALGCDGNIGTITVDLAQGTATADGGHKILACKNGAIEIESARYPFCFFGQPDSPDSTRGVLPFLPFNDELNRFQLVVKGTTAAQLKVTWGAESKVFPAADLAKGINLAAEFLDNPFAGPFREVEQKVRAKQNEETPALKQCLHDLPAYARFLPDEQQTLQRLAGKLVDKAKANAAAMPAAVAPVKHTITIAPAG